MNRPHVWIVNHYAKTLEYGGATRPMTFAQELVKRGYQTTVIAGSYSHLRGRSGDFRPGRLHAVEESAGVRVVWLRTPPYGQSATGRFLNMIAFGILLKSLPLARVVGSPEVVIGSSPHLFAASAASRIASMHGVPFILEVRDLWPQAQIELAGMSPCHPATRWQGRIEKRLYRKADQIVTLMPAGNEHIFEKIGPRLGIHYIPNGADLTAVPEPAPPPDEGPFTVLYAGSHGPKNALDTVLDAAKDLLLRFEPERLQFMLVGAGSEKERLQVRALEEGISNVRFLPRVSKSELYPIMQNAHAFVLNRHSMPINRYGISLNKLFDYMALARPTVIGSVARNNPIDEAGAGITVTPGDPVALGRGVVRVMQMTPDERWEMGMRGRRLIEEVHNVPRLVDILERVIAQARAGGAHPLEAADPATTEGADRRV